MKTKKTVLITGGAGFIGSHLSKLLIEKGYFVICLDNFFTGKQDNIRGLRDYNSFEVIRHDIINPLLLEVDQIYNLACPASPYHYQYNAIKTIKTNVLGIINMLGLARRLKVPILQASTSEVYGDPKVHPQRETYFGNVNPVGIRSCYDEGKRVAETLCMDYKRAHSMDIKIVRIFNTYGPNMSISDGRVVSNFIVQALSNKDITIYGNGEQTRSFCYVDDLVDGMYKYMNTYTKENIINLGNPYEITILELARIILKLIPNSKSKILHKELPPDDPIMRKPCIKKAKEVLGFLPNVPIEKGLRKTIDFFRKIVK